MPWLSASFERRCSPYRSEAPAVAGTCPSICCRWRWQPAVCSRTGRAFPRLRVRWSPYRDTCHTVEWGDPAPDWWVADAVAGHFYGYREEAIAAFIQKHPQTPSSATFEPYSPTAS